MGDDITVVNAARVSFGKQVPGVELRDKDIKLIYYLADNNHMSPFGHCFATFHVKAPIFVARQLVKHKFLRWNEISRRYVDSEPEFYIPEFRKAVKNKKQGSGGVINSEQNTMTEWYWSGSLDAWSDMCKLRCASDTQVETQEVAKKISVIMHKQFPVSWVALAKAYRR